MLIVLVGTPFTMAYCLGFGVTFRRNGWPESKAITGMLNRQQCASVLDALQDACGGIDSVDGVKVAAALAVEVDM